MKEVKKPDCLCYDCVKWLSEELKTNPDAFIDCACEGASDTYVKERCDNCDIRKYCDIFLHPKNYVCAEE